MKALLVQDKYEIALAHRGAVKSIRAIEPDIQFLGVALQLVTGQTVDLQALRIIQPFLAGEEDEPMIARKARRPAFPNLPLLQVHRSGFCLTLLMADSSAAPPLSGP